MSYPFTGPAGAALAFLICYLAIFGWMLFAFLTHRIKWRSRYLLLFSHVTIRVAAQICGIEFGVLGFRNTNLFLAFLILGAEGYFTLVMCTFHFVISWHQHNLASGQSWLKPRAVTEKLRKEAENYKRRKMLVFLFLGPFAFLIYRDNPPMVYFHLAFAYANIAIITGGSYLAGADYNDLNSPDTKTRLNISKITRTTGQSVFVAGNAMLLAIILVTMRNNRRDGDSRGKKGTVHPTLWLLFIAWFPLIVRGIFGILQASVFSLSYYNPDNYSDSGFTPHFTIIEYLLGVLTEWLPCVLLNLTYFTSRQDPSKPDAPAGTDMEKKPYGETAS